MSPPDRRGLLTALTTEHFTLQSTRAATITESLGRSTIYLGSLPASLVALALIARGERTDDLRLSALVILPAVVFLGTATFVRILETGIEDAICARAINRIRYYYLKLAGEHRRYFLARLQLPLLAANWWRSPALVQAGLLDTEGMLDRAIRPVTRDRCSG